MSAPATQPFCKVVMGFQIETGYFDEIPLAGLAFVLVSETPAIMAEGNWKVGLIVDERASDAQVEALSAITSGKSGGPLTPLSPLIGEFLGIERKPVEIFWDGLRCGLQAADAVDIGVEGTPSAVADGEPIYLENTLHPANKRLALGRAVRNRITAFGIEWLDDSGETNGHFAPFNWHS